MDNRIDKIRQSNEKKAELELKTRAIQDQNKNSKSLENVLFESFKSLVSVLEGDSTKAQTIGLIVEALDKLDKGTSDNKLEVATIKSGLETLEEQIKSIPTESLKQIPKFLQQRDTIKVTNLKELDAGLSRIEKAVKGMNLSVEAPVVNVEPQKLNIPAPVVNVPKTDLKPLQDTMLNVIKAIKAVKIPAQKETDLTKLEKEAKSHTKLLKGILDKPVGGGGGGGGRATPYQDSSGIPSFVTLTADGEIPIESSAPTTIATGQVSVGTSSTLVVAARTGRTSVTITMLGGVDAYLGVTGVTTSTGTLLLGAKGASFTLNTSAAVYGVAASTVSVSYEEEF